MTCFQLLLQHCSSAQAVPFAAPGQVRSTDLLQHHITMSYLLPEQSQAPFPSYIPSGEPQEVWWNQMTTGLFTVGKSLIFWVTPSNLLGEIPGIVSDLPEGSASGAADKLQHFQVGLSLLHCQTEPEPNLRAPGEAAVDSHKQAVPMSPDPLNLIITGFWTPAYPGSCREPQSISSLFTPRLFSGKTCFFCITKAEPSVNPMLQPRHSTGVYGAEYNHFCHLLCCS